MAWHVDHDLWFAGNHESQPQFQPASQILPLDYQFWLLDRSGCQKSPVELRGACCDAESELCQHGAAGTQHGGASGGLDDHSWRGRATEGLGDHKSGRKVEVGVYQILSGFSLVSTELIFVNLRCHKWNGGIGSWFCRYALELLKKELELAKLQQKISNQIEAGGLGAKHTFFNTFLRQWHVQKCSFAASDIFGARKKCRKTRGSSCFESSSSLSSPGLRCLSVPLVRPEETSCFSRKELGIDKDDGSAPLAALGFPNSENWGCCSFPVFWGWNCWNCLQVFEAPRRWDTRRPSCRSSKNAWKAKKSRKKLMRLQLVVDIWVLLSTPKKILMYDVILHLCILLLVDLPIDTFCVFRFSDFSDWVCLRPSNPNLRNLLALPRWRVVPGVHLHHRFKPSLTDDLFFGQESQEYQMTRNYLDWLTSMPWSVYSKDHCR